MFLQGFRNLVRKIQALKITIYEKELNEKQIELEFAQEQIRPHFFLNCISLIHGIADNKGETDIVTITSILSDYNDRRHVGLQNIKKRLNFIYGEQAEFHLSNMDENFGAISEVWITQQDKK